MGLNVIENELVKMTNAERLAVIEIAKGLIGREINERPFTLDEKRKKLKASAELATDLYRRDNELTIWTTLDSEDFINVQR